MTAPDFRPFERKFAKTRHLGRAMFLQSEEGEDLDQGSESEGDAEPSIEEGEELDEEGEEYEEGIVSESDAESLRLVGGKTIYIEEVLERVHK